MRSWDRLFCLVDRSCTHGLNQMIFLILAHGSAFSFIGRF